MNWLSFTVRLCIGTVLVCAILYWAEGAFPMASLLVLLLALSVAVTWLIINLLRDNNVLTDLFDD